MAWIIVFVAGGLEVLFALLLKQSHGFSRILPAIGAMATGAASFGLLTLALKSLPVGAAYAVWTGIGAAGTVLIGILVMDEPANAGRVASLAFIISGIVGLRLFS